MAEATGDLIANNIGDKLTSADKLKNKETEEDNATNKTQEMHISPEKRQQTTDDLRLLYQCINME